MTQQQDTSAMQCFVILDGLTTSPEIVKLMPSLGQVLQFSTDYSLFTGMAALTLDHH